MSASVMPESSATATAHAALLKSLQEAADNYQKPQELAYTYGTAGFRAL